MSGSIRFETKTGELAGLAGDVGIAYLFRGEDKLTGPVGDALSRRLLDIVRDDRFEGQGGRRLLWHAGSSDKLRGRRYIVLGLGPRGELTLERYRRYLGDALAAADRLGAATVTLPILDAAAAPFAGREAGTALAEGVLLGLYLFDRYRTGPHGSRRNIKEVHVALGEASPRAIGDGIAYGEVAATAANFARDLVNEPAGALTPTRMVEIARETARDAKLEIKVLEADEMRRLGMGGILGVGQGSIHPPRLIQIEYRPEERPVRRVVLAGKGLTFDSGGLSLKTPEGMETMKCDMSGAAAVLATLKALPELGPPVRVVGLLGMAENMPGSKAIRPGDILKIMNGKTVEVRNTDAEGRLVLADVLSYASTLKGVEEVVDLATLTGSVVIALGPMAAGLYGNDRDFVDALLRAAHRAGESVWPLPLYNEYREHIRSDVADIKNTSIRGGGSITAALFLREFVRSGLRWAHLDIAGPAFSDKEYSYLKKGGSGFGVRLLLRYLTDVA